MTHSSMHTPARSASVNSIANPNWARRSGWTPQGYSGFHSAISDSPTALKRTTSGFTTLSRTALEPAAGATGPGQLDLSRTHRAARGNRPSDGPSLVSCCLATLFAVLMLGMGSAALAADDSSKHFEIKAKPLADALMDFGVQSGLTVVAPTTLTAGKKATSVRGDLAPTDALHRLLKGSGLTFARAPDGTIAVQAISPSGPAPVQASAGESGLDTDLTGADSLQEIVVTGTHIHGMTEKRSTSTVMTFDRADIERSGSTTLQQFFGALPQNFGGGANETTSSTASRGSDSNFSYASSINLHGLGTGPTLTLINGRRVAGSGSLGNFVDISTIPLNAVARIDVLADGASAIYGSDAIAGVVNIVLREDFDGAETSLGYASVTQGSHDEMRASQSLGTYWTGGGGALTVDYYDRSRLDALDRSYSSNAPLPNDLIPQVRRRSVLMDGSQKLLDNARVAMDLTYSKRDTRNTFNDAFTIGTAFAEAERYGAGGSLTYSMPREWNFQFDGAYSRNREDVNNLRTVGDNTRSAADAKLSTLGIRFDGPLFNAPGGAALLAAGTEFRHEAFDLSQTAAEPFSGARNVYAIFSELSIPLVDTPNSMRAVQSLVLTAAGRFENYNDFGSTTNPRVGLRWTPLEGLAFRGAFSKSFQAPPLPLLASSAPSAALFPLPDPFSPDGATLTILPFSETNPDLRPERGESWTLGADITPAPVPGLRLSLNYFKIDYTDRIDFPVPNTELFGALANEAAFGHFIVRNPDIAVVQGLLDAAAAVPNGLQDFSGIPGGATASDVKALVSRIRSNTSALQVRGIDLDLRYQHRTGLTDWLWSLNGNYLLKYRTQGTSTAPFIDLRNTALNPVDLRLRGGLSWTRSGFNLSSFVNYTGDSIDTINTPNVPIASWTTVDLSASYQIDRTSTSFLSGTRFSLAASNLFDRDPPFFQGGTVTIVQVFGYDTTNANPLGRFLSLTVEKRW